VEIWLKTGIAKPEKWYLWKYDLKQGWLSQKNGINRNITAFEKWPSIVHIRIDKYLM